MQKQQPITNNQRGEAYEFFTAIVLNSNSSAITANPQYNDYEKLREQLVSLKFLNIIDTDTEEVTNFGANFISAVIGDMFYSYGENIRVGSIDPPGVGPGEFVDLLNDFLKVGANQSAEPGPVPINFMLQVMYLTSVGLGQFDKHFKVARDDMNMFQGPN